MSHEAPPLHALLVGIQHYPGSKLYPDLEGCVGDVQAMERYLIEVLGVPAERIETRVAPAETTYAGLTAALHRLEARCQRGDHALFHYSGHGGRTPTAFSQIKGLAGKDESLVPVDIADPNTPYLRDTEIDAWVLRMVEKGVFVTLVLDCCHSGGMRRIGEPRVRGGRSVDPQRRPLGEGLVSPREQRRALTGRESSALDAPPGRVLRHATIHGATRAASEGFALFAACRHWEKAREYAFDGVRPSGALTHFLLRALERLGSEASYQQLHAMVVQGIHSHFRRQTPVFEGEVRALPLGHRALPELRGIEVLDVEAKPASEPSQPLHVLLGAGYGQGVGEGARFDLYPLAAATADSKEARPVASAEVVEGRVSTCRAVLVETVHDVATVDAAVRPGDRAVLVDPGNREMPRSVRLPPAAAPVEELVHEIEQRLERRASPWLCPVDEAHADFEVRVTEGSESLSIHDLAGAPLPNLPDLPLGPPTTVDRLWRVLEHQARYEGVRSLRCEGSTLQGKVDVRFEPDPDETGLPAEALTAYPPEIATGQRLRLVVENRAYLPVHVAILDLQPDWGISQIFPGVSGSFLLDAGRTQAIRLQAVLPEGIVAGTDVLMVFAATVPFDGKTLELPSLTGLREAESRTYRSSATRGPRSIDAWLTVQRELRVVCRPD